MKSTFEDNWRIKVLRVCDTDDVRTVEAEVKRSLCTYHLEARDTDEKYRSKLGLNGN